MNSIIYENATRIAARIREKELSPVEVMKAHLDRIEAVNPRVNAIVSIKPEQALAAAKTAEAKVMIITFALGHSLK